MIINNFNIRFRVVITVTFIVISNYSTLKILLNHSFSYASSVRVAVGLVHIFNSLWAKGGVQTRKVASISQDNTKRHTQPCTHTLRDI